LSIIIKQELSFNKEQNLFFLHSFSSSRLAPGLVECQNAVLVPHIGSATKETRIKMGMLAAENIVARIRGQKLPSCVNPEVLSDSHNKL
jgi:lactate dehydrogenase-like 2-hydroxyacid dehydrogenase